MGTAYLMYQGKKTSEREIPPACCRALKYGESFFTTFLLQKSCAAGLESHGERLCDSLRWMGVEKAEADLIWKNIREQLRLIEEDAVVRPTVFFDGPGGLSGKRGKVDFAIFVSPALQSSWAEEYNLILSEVPHPGRGVPSHIKSSSYLFELRESHRLDKGELEEVVWMDPEGHFTDTAVCGLLLLEEGTMRFRSPDVYSLKSVTAELLQRFSRDQQRVVDYRSFGLEDLKSLTKGGLFIFNSIKGLVPVKSLLSEKREVLWRGEEDELTSQFKKEYERFVRESCMEPL